MAYEKYPLAPRAALTYEIFELLVGQKRADKFYQFSMLGG